MHLLASLLGMRFGWWIITLGGCVGSGGGVVTLGDGAIGQEFRGSVAMDGVGTLGGVASLSLCWAWEKMSLSCWMDSICASPREW